jgi:hypothetical protein
MPGSVYKADGSLEFAFCAARGAFWLGRVAFWGVAFWAFVDGCVGVSKFYCDAASEFFAVFGSPYAR